MATDMKRFAEEHDMEYKQGVQCANCRERVVLGETPPDQIDAFMAQHGENCAAARAALASDEGTGAGREE